MDKNETLTKRLVWIDWMKSVAMFFIIAGHCWVPGYKFIYTFSVPCFFILSGFLTKRENRIAVFWKKLWWNLIIPMLLIVTFNLMLIYLTQFAKNTFNFRTLLSSPLLIAFGMQGENYNGIGLGGMWFVYTLMLCKITFQLLPIKYNKRWLIILNIMCIIGALFEHTRSYAYNSFINTFLAMPFFTIGYSLRPIKKYISSPPNILIPFIAIVGGIGVYLCGRFNEIVMLYRCDYGNNILLCFIGALCGTMLIYSFCILIGHFSSNAVNTIGGGTIIILGFHFIVIKSIAHIYIVQGHWLYIESFLILLSFIPLIKKIKQHFPILYGKLRK